MDDPERQAIVAAIEAAMTSFGAAERALDAEQVIAHFAQVEDFHVYNDGERLDYAAVTANLRNVFPSLRSIEGGFRGVQVIVLAVDAALATAGFREVITDRTGNVTRVRGTASWLWRNVGGSWKIIYGHADHYPDDAGE
jgi:ketosteroid isomerase-like protein